MWKIVFLCIGFCRTILAKAFAGNGIYFLVPNLQIEAIENHKLFLDDIEVNTKFWNKASGLPEGKD